jgi:hypothetical protein
MASYGGVLIVSDVGRLSSPRLAMEVRARDASARGLAVEGESQPAPCQTSNGLR